MCVRDRDHPAQRRRRRRHVAGPGAQPAQPGLAAEAEQVMGCLLYTSDAADERSSVDLGGRRIIKKTTSYLPGEGHTRELLCIIKDTHRQHTR